MSRKRVSAQNPLHRRRKKRSIWQKALLLCLVVVVGFGAFAVIRKTARAGWLFFSERSAVRRMQSELTAKERENQKLKSQREYLRSQAGSEAEARKLGYVRPGEVSIMLGPQADESPSQAGE